MFSIDVFDLLTIYILLCTMALIGDRVSRLIKGHAMNGPLEWLIILEVNYRAVYASSNEFILIQYLNTILQSINNLKYVGSTIFLIFSQLLNLEIYHS